MIVHEKEALQGQWNPDRLKTLIEQNQKPLREIAKELDVSFSVLSDWKNGKKTPRADSIIRLAQYFEVSSDFLLGLTDAKSIKTDVRAASELTGLSSSTVERFAKINADPDGAAGPLTQRVLHLFDSAVQSGLLEIFLDAELFKEEIERMKNADEQKIVSAAINEVVSNLNRHRPSGMALISQSEYFLFKRLKFERAFGELLERIVSETGHQREAQSSNGTDHQET